MLTVLKRVQAWAEVQSQIHSYLKPFSGVAKFWRERADRGERKGRSGRKKERNVLDHHHNHLRHLPSTRSQNSQISTFLSVSPFQTAIS